MGAFLTDSTLPARHFYPSEAGCGWDSVALGFTEPQAWLLPSWAFGLASLYLARWGACIFFVEVDVMLLI